MTTCGILCPGPSLSAFLAAPVPYDITIGVNRAAAAHPCDVYAFGDAHTFATYPPVGLPILLTNRHAMQRVPTGDARKHRIATIDEFRVPLPRSFDETTYTVLIAIAYALDRQAMNITLHGCDLEGTDDWAGTPVIGENRTPMRWLHEAAQIREMVEFAELRGVRFDGLPPQVRNSHFQHS